MEVNKIYNMNCLEGLKNLPDNSIDSIVTDPPYELGFMQKDWDKSGIAYSVDLWKECFRVLKPGGHLLSFGGSRTYHRMACAIEDSGFEIRDQIMYLYGSGMPKGTDISKQMDKIMGAERTEGKREWKGGQRTGGIANSPDTNLGTQTLIKYDEPASPEGKQWRGWNTSLKPAHEPIVVAQKPQEEVGFNSELSQVVMARKPIEEKNIALNTLKWGTGGINVGECRVGDEERVNAFCKPKQGYKSDANGASGGAFSKEGANIAQGRFPANVIIDDEISPLVDEQSGVSKSTGGRYWNKDAYQGGFKEGDPNLKPGYGDVGGASRFFYTAKASVKERGKDNDHPTVKPQSLISYLIKLVTPVNGVILDPFMGSGTAALCCVKMGNYNYIGFEMDKHYCEIAEKRIKSEIESKK